MADEDRGERLPFRVAEFEELAAFEGKTFTLEDLYVEDEKGGGYVLAVAGAVDRSFRDKNIFLSKKERTLQQERKELLDRTEELEAQLQEYQDKAEGKGGGDEEAKAEMTRLRDKIRALEGEKQEYLNQVQAAKGENYNLQFDQNFQSVADKFGVKKNPRVRKQILQDFQQTFRLADGKFSPEDADGNLMEDDAGRPFTFDTWFESYRVENDDWAFETPKGVDARTGESVSRRRPGLALSDLSDPTKLTMETLQDIADGKTSVKG